MNKPYRFFKFLVLALSGVIAAGALLVTPKASPTLSRQPAPRTQKLIAPPDTKSAVHGFDVSHFNGGVSWDVVSKNDLNFVVLKATEGVDWVDPSFASHWQESKKNGFIRGAYHFFVSADDPVAEANWFIQNVALEPGDLPPVVDVERADKKDLPNLTANLKIFVSALEKHFGVPPIIYTGPKFWSSSIKEPFPNHALWVAEYGVTQPALPNGWNNWTFWQYSQQGVVSGVEKAVDLNTFTGTIEDLRKLLLPR